MEHYISKDAVVAEIDALQDATMENGHFLSSYHEGIFDGLSKIENFLDTLEVKGVDLEEEIKDYIEQHKSELSGYFDLRRIARHFFVLGLNTERVNKL